LDAGLTGFQRLRFRPKLRARGDVGRNYFISHVTAADGAAAHELADRLVAEGASAWLAPRDIPAGSPYSVAISDALEACDAIVVLLSPATAGSAAVASEVEIAVGRLRKPVYLVRLANIQPPKSIAFHVSTFQWIDAFGSLDAAARVIARGESVGRRVSSGASSSYQTRAWAPWIAIGAAAFAALAVMVLFFGQTPPVTTQQQTLSVPQAQPHTSVQRSDPPVEPIVRAPQDVQSFEPSAARAEPSQRTEPDSDNSSTLDFTEEPTR
jgi:TIR domain